jgi:hypothetical protein
MRKRGGQYESVESLVLRRRKVIFKQILVHDHDDDGDDDNLGLYIKTGDI